MGQLHMPGEFGELFSGPILLFRAHVEDHPISTKDQAKLHQLGKKSPPGKETYSLQTLTSCKNMTLPKSVSKETIQKKFSCRTKENFSCCHVEMVLLKWQQKIPKSDRPIEFGKIPKKEKNTAVICTEKRTNQDLQKQQEQDDLKAKRVITFERERQKTLCASRKPVSHPTEVL